MSLIRIQGVPPYDGEYPLDLSSFNGNELHLIKQLSGVRGNELKAALQAGDYDLLIAFAVIALRRNGQDAPPEALLEADVGKIVLDDDPDEPEAEEDARPPDSSPTPSGDESSPGAGENESEKSPPSGTTSTDTGGDHPSGLRAIGAPGSEDSADSDQEISAA